MAKTPTTPRLSEAARHLVVPAGIATSTFYRVNHRLRSIGVRFDPWQEGFGATALGCRKSGKYAATIGGVVASIPRQVGKTFTVGNLLIGLALEFPNLRVVWTSHHNRTTTNTFRSMQGMVRRRKVWPLVDAIRTANGEQEIRFANGSIIMFGAREFGFGVGLDAIDVLVFDEAQRLGTKALDDLVPTTNQAKHPHGALVFFIGTPPRPTDDGEAFTAKRQQALGGKAKDVLYVEFSADADADPDDREQWAKANPSYPTRTPLEAMLRMRENLPSDESWLREALGIWEAAGGPSGPIPMTLWPDCADMESKAGLDLALGVEVGPDLAWASVSLAGRRADGRWHMELLENRNGAAWLPMYLLDVLNLNPEIRGVVGDVGGPLKAMVTEVNGTYRLNGPDGPDGEPFPRLMIQPLRVTELGTACAQLVAGVAGGWLHHIDQPQLTAAAGAVGKRALADTGLWVFSRRAATSDITPIQAATYALWGAQNKKIIRPLSAVKRGGGRRYATRTTTRRGSA